MKTCNYQISGLLPKGLTYLGSMIHCEVNGSCRLLARRVETSATSPVSLYCVRFDREPTCRCKRFDLESIWWTHVRWWLEETKEWPLTLVYEIVVTLQTNIVADLRSATGMELMNKNEHGWWTVIDRAYWRIVGQGLNIGDQWFSLDKFVIE